MRPLPRVDIRVEVEGVEKGWYAQQDSNLRPPA